jgi:hypothetical protein
MALSLLREAPHQGGEARGLIALVQAGDASIHVDSELLSSIAELLR